MKVLGKLFGVVLEERGDGTPHVCLQLLVEDDGNWKKVGKSFSSHWIDDLMQTLQSTKLMLESQCLPDTTGWGYMFKKNNAPQEKAPEE